MTAGTDVDDAAGMIDEVDAVDAVRNAPAVAAESVVSL